MKHESLIEQLSSNLAPAPTLKSRNAAFVAMLAVSVLSGLALLALCGLRSNINEAIHEIGFSIELILLCLAAVASFRWASLSSVPGVLQKPQIKIWTLTGIALCLLILIAQHSGAFPQDDEWSSFVKSGSHCTILISICALLPIAWSYFETRKGACTRPRLSLALILVGSFSAAIMVQQVICPSDDLWHLLVWHFGLLPIAVLAALALGRKVLKL